MKLIFSHYGMLDGGDANGFTRNINFLREFAGLDHQVVFLTTQKRGFKFPYKKEVRSNVEIVAFPEIFPSRFRKGGIGPLSTLLKIIFVIFQKADIVYSDTGHRPSAGLPCLVHRFIYNSVYIADWWEHYAKGGIYDDLPKINQKTIGAYDNMFEVRHRKKADGCVVISHQLKNRAISEGISDAKILVLNTGADTSKIPYLDINSSKAENNIDPDTFVVSIIGVNKDEIANNEHILSSIKKLNENNKNTYLLTTGNLNKQVIEDSIIPNSWVHYEWIPYDQFAEIISCADLFSLIQIDNLRNASRFPNKFGDYISAGRPVITNSIGDLKIYSKEKPQFFYEVENNFESVYNKLNNAYDDWKNNKIDYKEIRAFAEQNSWNNRAERFNNFINKLCNNLRRS